MAKITSPANAPRPVNLDEAQKLVDALERDLARVRAGAGDVETLRQEVEALRGVLSVPQPEHADVRERLHGVKSSLESVGETLYEDAVKVGEYLSRIGRMLGL
jgi:predicted nuclease with TOPRIM domain